MYYPIYPKISETSRGNFKFQISTVLRKRHTDGKWYRCKFIKSGNDRENVILQLTGEIYLFMILGIVSPTMKMFHGEEFLHELDEDQRSEEERLRKTKA